MIDHSTEFGRDGPVRTQAARRPGRAGQCYTAAMQRYQWLLYAVAGAVAAAAIAPLGERRTQGLDSKVVTAVRSLVQAMVVSGVVTLMGRWSNLRQFDRQAFVMAALAGLAGGVS